MAKPKQQLPPPIGTRKDNKTNRPGVKAGMAPKPRRPIEEIEADRQRKAQEKQEKSEHEARSTARVADIEDKLRKEDDQRKNTANHPPVAQVVAFQPRSLRKPAASKETSSLLIEGDEQSDGADEYLPGSGPESMDEGEDNVVEDEDDQAAVEKPRKRKMGRNDVATLRKTDVLSGEQLRIVDKPPTKKQKSLASQKKKTDAFVKDWKPRAKGDNPVKISQVEDEDSMVRMGGFVGDDEDDVVEQVAAKAASPHARGRKELPSMVKITGSPFIPRTQKELRGGRKKWSLTNLPDDYAREKFSDTVVLLAKQKAGTQAPWGGLTTAHVQEIIDATFGEGEYPKVEPGDPWTGLIAYRLNDWRAGFAAAGRNAVTGLFQNNEDSFPDEKAIRKAAKWYTKWYGSDLKKTAAYQWREWNSETSKKGFCQSALIIETFAIAHLSNIHKLPTPTDSIDNLPVGALILSLQAVEHALNEYQTGTQVINKTSKGHFSADNYGDKLVKEADKNGRPHIVNKPWASRYVATIKKFDVTQWEFILSSAQEYLDALPPRRGRKSRSSSQASSSVSMEVYEEILFESDVENSAAADKNGNLDSHNDSSSESSKSDSEESVTEMRIITDAGMYWISEYDDDASQSSTSRLDATVA